MSRKISKGIHRKVPLPGTRAYASWHLKLVNGMRQAKLRRRESGLMTLKEVAVELCLSLESVRQMGFPIITAGSRRFIRRNEVDKWKLETGADSAA
jgi:hypothetical protein